MGKNKGKVKCRVCQHEEDAVCNLKKCKVKTNKARNCDDFVFVQEKIKIKKKLPSVMRPDWYWNRKEAIQAYKKNLLAKEAQAQAVAPPQYLDNSSLEKPDCLSNFRSTAGKLPEDDTN